MEEASGENHKAHVMRWGTLPANGTDYQPNQQTSRANLSSSEYRQPDILNDT